MRTRDPRIDAYIRKAAPFARPILKKLRAAVHAACPGATETLKWSHPSFEHHGILCGFAAFRQHCTFGFWKSALITDADGGKATEAMNKLGCLESVADLPPARELAGYIRQAAKLNESGTKLARPTRKPKPVAKVPPDLAAALRRNAAARKTFQGFSPSARREYVEWITEARRPETRSQRLATAIAWLAEGKPRNWKYMKSW